MRRILMALVLTSGCSIAFQPHPPTTAKAESSCAGSPAFWIIDGVAFASAAGAAGYGMVIGDNRGSAITGVSVITGILFLASAVNGYRDWKACGSPADAEAHVRFGVR